jgi:hypothetical protein
MPPGSIVFIVLLFGGALLNLLSIIMLSVVTLSVVMLSFIMLNVVVPKNLFNQTPTRVDVTKNALVVTVSAENKLECFLLKTCFFQASLQFQKPAYELE